VRIGRGLGHGLQHDGPRRREIAARQGRLSLRHQGLALEARLATAHQAQPHVEHQQHRHQQAQLGTPRLRADLVQRALDRRRYRPAWGRLDA
jgi:hypothetical protein